MSNMQHVDAQDIGLTETEIQKIIDSLPVVHLQIERHQGQFYAWNQDTNEFLGQGTDRNSLIERISEQARESVAYRMPANHQELFGD